MLKSVRWYISARRPHVGVPVSFCARSENTYVHRTKAVLDVGVSFFRVSVDRALGNWDFV